MKTGCIKVLTKVDTSIFSLLHEIISVGKHTKILVDNLDNMCICMISYKLYIAV